MTKTAREWFMELPDGFRELALAEFPEDRLNMERGSMANALISYPWNLMPSGHRFWRAVFDYYYEPDVWGLPALPAHL
jgi:N-glycosylase/DNA lyase